MKGLLTMCLLGSALLLCADLLQAETPAQKRVRVALALSKTSSCPCGASCNCLTGECGSPDCPSLAKTSVKSPSAIEWARYLVKYNLAISQKKPLIIWVGETCPPCEAKWTDFVHAHLSEYDGAKGVEAGPEVIIGKPDGLGGITVAGRIDGIPTKPAIDALLALKSNSRDDPTWGNVNPYNHNSHWPYQSLRIAPPMSMLSFRPMMAPMMPIMGGFGGFGGGFGGGGGGCGPGG